MTKGKSAATKAERASAARSKQPPRKAKTKLEQLEAMLRRSAALPPKAITGLLRTL